MDDIRLAAKELYDVWSDVIILDILANGFKVHHQRWDELPELQQKAWIAVSNHTIEQAKELFKMMIIPDHR